MEDLALYLGLGFLLVAVEVLHLLEQMDLQLLVEMAGMGHLLLFLGYLSLIPVEVVEVFLLEELLELVVLAEEEMELVLAMELLG